MRTCAKFLDSAVESDFTAEGSPESPDIGNIVASSQVGARENRCMSDSPPSRLRLDAVAWSLFALGALVTAALATLPALTGLEPALGPDTALIVTPFANALGYAAFVFLAGWFGFVLLYVLRRGWLRLAVRSLGWLVLTATAAALGDYRMADFPRPGTIHGPGGALGAFLRFWIDDHLPANLVSIVLAISAFVGVLLVADTAVRAILRRVIRSLKFGNRIVEAGSNKVVTALASGGRKPPVSVFAPRETGGLRPPLAKTPADIPIISHSEVVDLAKPTAAEQETIAEFQLPSLSLLNDPDPFPVEDHESFLRERATLLEKTFAEFAINVKVVGIHTGPVITQYEIALETGLRLNKVTTLSEDIALKLKVPSVRIVAPLPGRDTVGIEVPNEHRQTVRLKELILATQAKAAKMKLPVFLGKDVEGRPLCYDLADMPHLLIAGRTGTGKSVCLNTVLQSFLFTRRPDECRLILIDPKQVEFSGYANIPHLMHPVVTKNEKAEAILAWAVDKMEERYELLRRARVRNIASYNELGWEEVLRRVDPQDENERQKLPAKMPYVVIVIDEVGDLLMSMKKEVESHIIRLAQKSRAAGIHLILATQRPTVDVVTGLIKSNLPARICFQVASRSDSGVVLDEKGAEKLLGRGDMLFLQPGTSTLVRGQGAYVDDQEIERVTAAIELDTPNYDTELLNVKAKTDTLDGDGDLGEKLRSRDEMYEQAIEIVVREQRGSTSLLQRALGIGYGRASRLIDFMAEDGLVGGYNGSNARDVLLTPEEWEAKKAGVG
jgi:S-DNA-T family DNA segregation ATPase FtsK/SpoIIIE